MARRATLLRVVRLSSRGAAHDHYCCCGATSIGLSLAASDGLRRRIKGITKKIG
jgi:hypothetical protein